MNEKFTIERTDAKVVTLRHVGNTWRIVSTRSGFHIDHRAPTGKHTETFLATRREIHDFVLEIMSIRLDLSDFWNGQLALSLQQPK